MGKRCVRTILLSGLMSVVVCWTMLTDVSAGARPAKDQPSAESADRSKKFLPNSKLKEPIRQKTEQIPARAKAQDGLSETPRRPAKGSTADLGPKSRPGPRQSKGGKKAKTQAVIKPRTDLMYHGILENPSRYDPRQNRQTAGAPDPQTPELTHDHFQELDRNRDGKIDPVERVFGRLDMDRDLSTRQWQ